MLRITVSGSRSYGERCKIWLSLRMFLFHPIHFLKFLVKSQRSLNVLTKKVLMVNCKTHSGGVGLLFKCARFWKETSRASVKMELGRNALKYFFLSSTRGDPYFRCFAPRVRHSFISACPSALRGQPTVLQSTLFVL